jgi:hypothetical protein
MNFLSKIFNDQTSTDNNLYALGFKNETVGDKNQIKIFAKKNDSGNTIQIDESELITVNEENNWIENKSIIDKFFDNYVNEEKETSKEKAKGFLNAFISSGGSSVKEPVGFSTLPPSVSKRSLQPGITISGSEGAEEPQTTEKREKSIEDLGSAASPKQIEVNKGQYRLPEVPAERGQYGISQELFKEANKIRSFVKRTLTDYFYTNNLTKKYFTPNYEVKQEFYDTIIDQQDRPLSFEIGNVVFYKPIDDSTTFRLGVIAAKDNNDYVIFYKKPSLVSLMDKKPSSVLLMDKISNYQIYKPKKGTYIIDQTGYNILNTVGGKSTNILRILKTHKKFKKIKKIRSKTSRKRGNLDHP